MPICKGRTLKVTVQKGLALDCMGNPIEVPSPQVLEYELDCDVPPKDVWVVACYNEKSCRPRELSCAYDGADDRAMTRYKQGFEIKLYGERPDDACHCDDAKPDRPKGPQGNKRCCPPEEETTADAAQEQADRMRYEIRAQSGLKECYLDHMLGKCDCGCGCNCVVIGKFKIDRERDFGDVKFTPDYSPVRRIRPMLIGQFPDLRDKMNIPGNRPTDAPQPAPEVKHVEPEA
jgi:hypothetical protein